MKALILLTILTAVGTALATDEAPTPIDPIQTIQAENKVLRSTVARQAKEITQLQAQLDLLAHRLKILGITGEQLEATDAAPEDAARGGKPRRVVFVIDASGSMINSFGAAKVELLKAVRSLEPSQLFNVFVPQDERMNAFQQTLVPATPENVCEFITFLDRMTTTGTTNPIPSLQAALKLRPTVLWLITDGDFPDNNAVLQTIRQHNRGGCRINAVLMGPPGEQATSSFAGLLRTLADQNRGIAIDSTGKPLPAPARAAPKPPLQPRQKKFSEMNEDELPGGPSIFRENRD
jgi:uncharacterized protein with von Willebrand factor type A (vWA) domain